MGISKKCAGISDPREIRLLAEKLIEEILRIREDGGNRRISLFELLPIVPRDAAIIRGIKMEEAEELDSHRIVEGAADTNTSRIRIARTMLRRRQRFTEAHELGHLLLGHPPGIHLRVADESGTRPPAEMGADKFATEFLMPEPIVTMVYGHYFEEALNHRALTENQAYFLCASLPQKFSRADFARMSLREFSKIVSVVTSFGGAPFRPLVDLFDVSAESMARRLEELRYLS
jgi:hypothetical protein